ncbi:dTDP-4-dehydrorhamnose 3,5-epimerase [Rhizobium sp. Root482]|uniref:dTDP-4-dehydrorhamnose 3,5-epimerase n=1 Tax=Rhizobium sp. Root482 TaxID=1736543 RepID=UPI0006F74D0C|nr:dTDP-4-dehydrorhamnose 3,5-epimerase [Rhizobium sp. Root482]KQY26665.1 dTDP-4-dehydrorhamnose 3,5-epimerase [Rhizobium sp. Root482]
MRFTQTELDGVWVIDPDIFPDERGSFSRTFCTDEFARHGLIDSFVQHSVSTSTRRHTLRGLHFQTGRHQEAKVVACVQGAIWDVAVDLRPGSPNFRSWVAVELSALNARRLYIPKGFAHGFLSLAQNSTVEYLISERYAPAAASGARYDDPALAINWPAAPAILSDKDRCWPLLDVQPALSRVAKA